MDLGKFKKLNNVHVIFLVQNVMIGTGLLSLPHLMSATGYNQWYIPLLLGIIAQITLIPMVFLGMKYPGDTLFSINEKLLGKWLGKIINFIIVIYTFISVIAAAKDYIELVQIVTLPETTITWLFFVLFLVSFYIVFGGIKLIARFCIISFFATVWMLIFSVWGFQKGLWSHITPVFNFTEKDLLIALNTSYKSMLGYELIMIYFPYIINQKKAFIYASIGIWIVGVVYLLVSLEAIFYFTDWQLANLTYPILNLLQAVELPFIERIENFGIGLWVFLVLSTIAGYLWATKKGVDSVLGKDRTIHLYLIGVIIFASIQWSDPHIIQFISEVIGDYLGYGIILWPNALVVLYWIFGRKKVYK